MLTYQVVMINNCPFLPGLRCAPPDPWWQRKEEATAEEEWAVSLPPTAVFHPG